MLSLCQADLSYLLSLLPHATPLLKSCTAEMAGWLEHNSA